MSTTAPRHRVLSGRVSRVDAAYPPAHGTQASRRFRILRTLLGFAHAWLCFLAVGPGAAVAQDLSESPPLVIEDLQCRGNSSTACSFILGQVYLLPGDRIDEKELQNARLRLASLRNFESVDIFLEKGSARGRAIVIVEVAEADPIVRELATGTSARHDAVTQFLGARLSHQNLFGTGKILDLTVRGRTELHGFPLEAAFVNLRYADPHLFDSKRYFFLAGAGYGEVHGTNKYGEFFDVESGGVGFSFGRRFWDFSYLIAGYDFLPKNEVTTGSFQKNGDFVIETRDNQHVLSFGYGWNSEDDYFFPTRGSGFSAGFNWAFGSTHQENDAYLQFRKTWQTHGGSLWTIKIGGQPQTEYRRSFDESQLHTIGFARPIAPSEKWGIKRGRWYIEHGLDPAGTTPEDHAIYEFGLKVGVRLEIDSFGLVDLYVLGSVDWVPYDGDDP